VSTDLKEILEGLKREYLKNLPEKLKMIEQLWKDGKIDLVETEFHKLKGTGKTYGLPEISELGLVAEDACSLAEPARAQCIQVSLEILRQIHSTRITGQEFDLKSSEDFSTLISLSTK